MVAAVLIAALLPAVLCAILLATLRAWRTDAAPRLSWAVPLAVAAGFIAAQVAVDGVPRLPPVEASGWFSPLVLVLGVFAIAVRPRLGARLALAGTTLSALLVVIVIVYPLIGEAWSYGEAAAWIAGMTAVVALVAWLVDRRNTPGPGAPVTMLIAATGVAAFLTLCGSARYGQLGGAVASAMGPLALLGLFRRGTAVLGSGAWLSVMTLAMLVVAGVAYVDVPAHLALLVMAAPLGILVGDLPPLTRWPWWGRDLARCAAAAVLVGLAIGLAAANQSTPY